MSSEDNALKKRHIISFLRQNSTLLFNSQFADFLPQTLGGFINNILRGLLQYE
jgi:hypothetical protein